MVVFNSYIKLNQYIKPIFSSKFNNIMYKLNNDDFKIKILKIIIPPTYLLYYKFIFYDITINNVNDNLIYYYL